MNLDGIGLVCSGRATQSFLVRMPSLLARLGPIKSSSFRASRQISNALGAGHAASHYSAFESCPMVWIATPEPAVDRTLRDLAARTPLRGTMVVLWDYVRDSRTPSALCAAGARVASLNPVPECGGRLFVGEGHPDTLRAVRRLLAEDGRKLIELKPGGKPLFFAGVHFGSPLLLPWIAAGVESLRAAGFTRSEATQVGECLGIKAVRSYTKAGPKVWNRKTATRLRDALEHDLAALRESNPSLADLYEQGIRFALKQG